jgi:DsbC/DsbD-like thiol-disulfide interchange protein
MTKRLILALALAVSAPAARAETGTIVSADLLTGWRAADGTHVAAVRLRLAPGWKTYWRAPGEAGIPPAFDWSGSRNIAAVQIEWPRPEMFSFNGMRTLGYARELVLPVRIAPRDPAAPIRLDAVIDLGVCKDICVPASLAVTGDLPSDGAADPAIRAALAARPETAAEAGVRRHACTVDAEGDGLRVTAEVEVPPLGRSEMAVIEAGDETLWVGDARTVRQGARLVAVADVVPLTDAPVTLDRRGLTVTLLSEGRAVELHGCPAR